jgi:hypothetical protein
MALNALFCGRSAHTVKLGEWVVQQGAYTVMPRLGAAAGEQLGLGYLSREFARDLAENGVDGLNEEQRIALGLMLGPVAKSGRSRIEGAVDTKVMMARWNEKSLSKEKMLDLLSKLNSEIAEIEVLLETEKLILDNDEQMPQRVPRQDGPSSITKNNSADLLTDPATNNV